MAQLIELARAQIATELGFLSWTTQKDESFVADKLAPVVTVKNHIGSLLEKDMSENDPIDWRRAPGAPAATVRSGYKIGTNYFCFDQTVKERVTWEDVQVAQEAFATDVFAQKGATLARRAQIAKEIRVAAMFRSLNPLSFAYNSGAGVFSDYSNQVNSLSGGACWDQSSTCDPFGNILTAKDWFAANTAVEPNIMIMSAPVAYALRESAEFKKEYGTFHDLQEIGDLPGTLRGISVYVAQSKYKLPGTLASFRQIWGSDCWIGYVDQIGNGTSGHAVQVKYAGGEIGTKVWQDPELDRKLWFVQQCLGMYDYVVPRSGGSVVGYLIRNALSTVV
jgi:hypothetical protein